MLELKNIHKDYPAGSGIVHALRGVDLQFRKSEFVSILGPSGCGKTTLLNIIGGLDQYTKGDLVINGKSTKAFKDRDWDGYRNHSVGFVFQTYNLIPHQTVLQNVELALTLSGVSRKIRRQKAAAALEAVGLGDQLRKRPSQLSGGQMQRVAIARALVNNPDIILADEPTGALDSETSVQVMEILKEVAKDRLVVMVTHNPELADAYSTRIIRMLDGKMQSDSMPLTEEELETYRKADREEAAKAKKEKKPTMNWATAFGLSLKNLIAKGGRTTLTSFAGSIGIIGIALIYAVSQGMTTYIDTVQEDTLSSYPLTIEASTVDLSSLMAAFMETAQSNEPHENDAVYSKGMLYDLVNSLSQMETTENDLRSFKEFMETQMQNEDGKLKPAINGIQYTYDMNLAVYTESVDGTVIESDAEKLMQRLMSEYLKTDISALIQAPQNSSLSPLMATPRFVVWQEMLAGDNGALVNELLTNQYDVIYGTWPTEYDEVVLIVDDSNEISDLALYALGLKSEEDMRALMEAADKGTSLENTDQRWSYEEICGMEFHAILPGACYVLDENTGTYSDIRETEAGMRYLYDNGLKLKITGIIRPSEDAVAGMLAGTIGYTSALTEYAITQAAESDVVKAQKDHPDVDIITGLPFKAEEGEMTDAQKEADFRSYVEALTEAQKAAAYVTIMSIPDAKTLDMMTQQGLAGKTPEDMKAILVQALVSQMGMSEDTVTSYVEDMSEEDVTEYFTEMVVQQATAQYAAQVQAQLSAMSDMQLAGALMMAMPTYTTEQCAIYYDAVLEFSESNYEDNLVTLGCLDLNDPATMNIYASSFENKDVIEEVIAEYNEGVDETKRITYTDYVGLMMSSITTIINAITYVLISFVAISLVVSSIMIGVITLISVQERTKEIGILRAIGASKSNVSSMFNAETVIIGAASGMIGIGLTYLLCIPINAIIHYLTGIPNLSAYLPGEVALVLIGISIFLSVFAGFIPSRSAAKKDPVVALRTE